MHETLPRGWRVESVRSEDPIDSGAATTSSWTSTVWVRDVYTHIDTGKQLVKTPRNAPGFVPPPGCRSLLEVHADLARHTGLATHYLSYGWNIPVNDLAEAVKYLDECKVPFRKRPEDGGMHTLAFALDPDGYSVEIIQKNAFKLSEE